MANTVRERDLGWKAIRREIDAAEKAGVKVGVLSDTQSSNEGADMLLIAAANEFGTGDGRIPPRPFIRGAFDDKRSALSRTKDRLWDQVLQGRMTVKRALGLLGEQHQGQIQAFMTALDDPPNAPSTVAGKRGSTNPLIDTGRLRGSIRWELD